MDAGVYAMGMFFKECGTALALLGRSDRQFYALWMELLGPELETKFIHLCNVSTPVSVLLLFVC